MGRLTRIHLGVYNHGLVPDTGHAVGWTGLHRVALVCTRPVFHISCLWLSSALHGWTGSGSQAWLLMFWFGAICSANMLLRCTKDYLSHLCRCIAVCC